MALKGVSDCIAYSFFGHICDGDDCQAAACCPEYRELENHFLTCHGQQKKDCMREE